MQNRLLASWLPAFSRPAATGRSPVAPVLSLLLSAALLVVGGCKKSATNSNEIVVGHVASLTGDTATFGVSCEEGIRLALDEINAGGGVLGKQVVVKTEDDRSMPDEAKTATNKLITRDNVVALLGEIASSRSLAMAPEAQAAQVPMLSPGSTNPKVTQAGDYVFRSCFIDPFQGEAMARVALDELKVKRVAILYPNNSDYGVGLKDYVLAYLNKHGAEVVAQESYQEKGDVQFNSQLTKINSAKPEAVFVTGYYGEASLIVPQARGLGMNMPFIGGDGWDSDKLIAIGGAAMNGCYFTNHYSPDEDRPEVKAFVEAYKKKFGGKIPDAMAVLGYDSMKMLADAIRRAGEVDSKKIRDALAATKDFKAVAGTITMDANRDASKAIVVLKIEDSKFKYQSKIEPK